MDGRFTLELGVRSEMGLNYFYKAGASILEPYACLAYEKWSKLFS